MYDNTTYTSPWGGSLAWQAVQMTKNRASQRCLLGCPILHEWRSWGKMTYMIVRQKHMAPWFVFCHLSWCKGVCANCASTSPASSHPDACIGFEGMYDVITRSFFCQSQYNQGKEKMHPVLCQSFAWQRWCIRTHMACRSLTKGRPSSLSVSFKAIKSSIISW